jgi:hypothetical protein
LIEIVIEGGNKSNPEPVLLVTEPWTRDNMLTETLISNLDCQKEQHISYFNILATISNFVNVLM